MWRYTIKRILALIPTSIGVLLLTFVLFHVVGGSPAEVVLGQHANAEAIAEFNARFGYDKPLLIGPAGHRFDSQLFFYMSSLLRGDFGDSTAYGMRVADVLRQGVVPSLTITVPILVGGTILALMLAMVAAAWRGKGPDKAVLLGSTVLMSVNYVVWILAGQFFLSYKLRLFPLWGFEGISYILLPVAIGIFSGLGRDIRFFRTVILDELTKPYVRTAMSKGLSRRRVLWGHVFRNSLIPVVTYVSLSIPYLFTGSLLLESFFGIPGLGGVSLNAINSSDMATVRAVVILGSFLYQAVHLVTDLCYAWLDPRVRLS